MASKKEDMDIEQKDMDIEQEDMDGNELQKNLTPEDPGYWDEKIPYKPFYDGVHYVDDIFVCVNGENRLIKRDIDEPVMLERKFVQAIKDAEEQERESRRYQLKNIDKNED